VTRRESIVIFSQLHGDPDTIRTCDLQIRNVLRQISVPSAGSFPAALKPPDCTGRSRRSIMPHLGDGNGAGRRRTSGILFLAMRHRRRQCRFPVRRHFPEFGRGRFSLGQAVNQVRSEMSAENASLFRRFFVRENVRRSHIINERRLLWDRPPAVERCFGQRCDHCRFGPLCRHNRRSSSPANSVTVPIALLVPLLPRRAELLRCRAIERARDRARGRWFEPGIAHH
jgi:hypothetical protein